MVKDNSEDSYEYNQRVVLHSSFASATQSRPTSGHNKSSWQTTTTTTAILATAAFLVASISAQQDPLDTTVQIGTDAVVESQDIVEPTLAEPVAFISAGHGRLIPLTGSELETIERGEWPQSRPDPIPQTEEQFKASGLSGSEIQNILDHHNYYRSLHGAPPLSWNWDAANFGENWLQKCNFQHSHGRFGENLAAGYSDFPAAIKAWYDEVSQYDFNNPGFSSRTGHFTQVVWKGTRSVGCAKRACPSWTIYICDYDPPGNIVSWDNGYFRDNVSPRV
ncbi:hypothetical protein FBU30_001094 [Linnemannia zychae]|nr:hypothetical protein FBU30_001094 [Linnemannia zychae]